MREIVVVAFICLVLSACSVANQEKIIKDVVSEEEEKEIRKMIEQQPTPSYMEWLKV